MPRQKSFVEGLQIEVSHLELRRLLHDKAKMHRKRAEAASAQLTKFKQGDYKVDDDGDDELANVVKNSTVNYQESAEKALQASIKNNTDKAKVYVFLAEHLVKKTYRLTHENLEILGLVMPRF